MNAREVTYEELCDLISEADVTAHGHTEGGMTVFLLRHDGKDCLVVAEQLSGSALVFDPVLSLAWRGSNPGVHEVLP